MKRYLIFITITIFGFFELCAQFDPKPQIQLPGSDAKSLGKFGEIPVDLHTGRVNINIPIYMVKYYDIEVPISISYHGGGIKVSDEAGSVGLGWTLNVGGVINRIVRGIPDDLLENRVAGFEKLNRLTLDNQLNQFKEFIQLLKGRNPERNPIDLHDPRTTEERKISYNIYLYGDEYDKGHFDTSPDNYSFNVQGLSGVFVHKDNHQLILQSNDGVEITKEPSGNYVITDANGYTYQFNEQEKQTYFYKVGYDWFLDDYDTRPEFCYKYTSSWWLSSITSPTGEKINFYYRNVKTVSPRIPFYGYIQGEKRNSIACDFFTETNTFNNRQRADTVYRKLLDRIETPNSIVKFNYQSTNYLLESTPKLKNIAVYARADTTRAVENTKFYYDGVSDVKVMLLKLEKQGKGENKVRAYSFSYKTSSLDYPTYTEDKRYDHWGYYAPDSKGTFPWKRYSNINQLVGNSAIQFSTRNANGSTATNNMLSKITYPTGGTTEFEWEPHTYSQLSKLGSTASLDGPIDNSTHSGGSLVSTEWHTDKRLTLCGKSVNEVLTASYSTDRFCTIKIDLSKYYPIDIGEGIDQGNLCYSYWNDGDNFELSTIGDRPHILIKKNGKLIRLIHVCKETVLHPITIDNIASGANYTFELRNPREAFNQNIVECEFLYDDYFNHPETNYGYLYIEFGNQMPVDAGYPGPGLDGTTYVVGGVRIKQITNKPGNGTTSIKRYNYLQNPDDPNSPSSGVLAYLPRYGSFMQRCITTKCDSCDESGASARITDAPYLLTLRSNGLPYSLNGGSHIEYSKVTEALIRPDQKTIQRTDYSYWTGADYGCSDIDDTDYRTSIPTDMLQLTSQNHFRGHLKEKTEYTDERKTYIYEYEILEKPVTETITGAIFTIGDYTLALDGRLNHEGKLFYPYKDLGIVEYRVIPYNKRLRSVTSEGTKSNGYDAYTYANKNYSQYKGANAPLSYSTVDSKGDTITQHFTYVSVNLNRIHTCVTEKKGKIIDAYRNEYDTQGRIVEKYIASLNSDNLPSAKGYNVVSQTNKLIESYLYYNNRLVQLTDHQSGISTVYLWSYQNTYPVAEIKNATFSVICDMLGENVVNSLKNETSPNLFSINGLRDRLSESLVSTMTYELLKGITSFTDSRGITTYYDYDSFGKLKECYVIENGQKKILQKMEYHWTH